MPPEITLLNNYLLVGAVLFGVGLIGFISRRNMIVMFLSLEMMLQGVSLNLVAWSRFHNDFGGQMLVIFIIAVAACEAALALALVLVLFRRSRGLDIAVWQRLRESDLPPWEEETPTPVEEPTPSPSWPRLAPAGRRPEVLPELTDFRREV